MTFDQFLKRYENKPVEVFPHRLNKSVLVSVCVVTYKHANFIKQCLDNILSQNTNFDYEILLGEDASTDGTREICIEYAEKHSSKIRLFLHHRENNIKIGDQPTGRFNFLYNLFSANGKYIAMCEGDDYWTDPLKLQKQVDFLGNNNNFSGIATNSILQNDITNKSTLFKKTNHNKTFNLDNFLTQRNFHTASFLFKSQYLKSLSFPKIISADRFLFLYLASKKPIFYLNEVTCVYRKNDGGISRKVTSNDMIKDLNFIKAAKTFLNKKQLLVLKTFIYKTIFQYSHKIKLSHYFFIGLKLLFITKFKRSSFQLIKRSYSKVSLNVN